MASGRLGGDVELVARDLVVVAHRGVRGVEEPAHLLEVTRALPHNVTTEMDLALWQVARTVRDDPESSRLVADLSPAELADRHASGGLSPAGTAALEGLLPP